MRQYYTSNGYWIYQTDGKGGTPSEGLEISSCNNLKSENANVTGKVTSKEILSYAVSPAKTDSSQGFEFITDPTSNSPSITNSEVTSITPQSVSASNDNDGPKLSVKFASKLTFDYSLDGNGILIANSNGSASGLGQSLHISTTIDTSTITKQTSKITITAVEFISDDNIRIHFKDAEITHSDTYTTNEINFRSSNQTYKVSFTVNYKITFSGYIAVPMSTFYVDGYRTYILNNSGNDTSSTTSYTQTSGTDRFWIGLTDNSVFTSYPLDTFVKVGVEDGHGDINNICFNNKFYARNLKRKTDYAFYEIPLASVEMFQALEQIRSPSDSGLGIGTLKVKDVFSSHEILSQFEGTIDEYVNLLLANYSKYNGISPREGDINSGKYDSQLLAFPLPSDSNERKSLEEKIVSQYRLNGQSNLLSCKPEYNNKTINFDFLKSIFKVEDAKFYDSPENPLEQLTVMSYEITHAPVEGLSMGASTGDYTFDIASATINADSKPVTRYIAEVTAQKGTFALIEKAENKNLDYKALYELQYGREATENKLNNTKLLIKAENLTNTIDDFYYKKRIFASGGSTEVPKRTIKKQWINAQVLFDESSNECYVSLSPDSNGTIQDIIKSDGSPEDLAGQDRDDKFRNGAGMFDMGNSKVVTNNYKEYVLTDILSKIFLKRSDGNTLIYDLYYNNDTTTITAEDINKEKGIISFKFFLYSFGFSWTKYDGNVKKCYANKLCFISEDDMSKDPGGVKYQFGITETNAFYDDVKFADVKSDAQFKYYTLTIDPSGGSPASIQNSESSLKDADRLNGEIGPFIKSGDANIENNIKYALSKNKRENEGNLNYIYDSFRSVTAFRPFTDGDMTSELKYENDVCKEISLDKGFIHDYMLKYNEAYTVVKKIENGAEGDDFIIKAGDQNSNIVFAKAVPEKDFVEKQVLTNQDLKDMGVNTTQILEDIKGDINNYSKSILEATVHYDLKTNELTSLESTSIANNTYVVYKLYIDDTLDALDGEPDEKTVPPVRVDETEFTINIYPFDKDGRGNTVAGTPYIKYGTIEDVDGSITESTSSNLLYSKKFTISSAKDEVDVYDDWLYYKGIMPILLNESLESLREDFNTDDVDRIINGLSNRNLSNVIFNNVTADGKDTEKQAYSAMSCMNVYSEESIKNQENYTNDVKAEKWWNIDIKKISPIGYNGIKLTTSSNTTQNIYIGLEPNLIEKQLAIFAQSIYDYKWYLKATNNALIEVYPNETFTFEYVIDNDSDEASIDVTHIFGDQTAVDKNTHTQHKLFTVNSTDNDEDNIGASSFEQISLAKEKFTRIADSSFIESAPNDANINAYISEKKTYHCLVLTRNIVEVKIDTNGGWMLDPDAIVTKRDDEKYPISNKFHISPELTFKDDDLYAKSETGQLDTFAETINNVRRNFDSEARKTFDPETGQYKQDSSITISVDYAAPTNEKYINAIDDRDKRYLGISYSLGYNVPVGVHLTEKFTGETTTVNYVNELISIKTDEWTYGDEKNGVKTIDLNSYTVNVPEKMEKTTYVFNHYLNTKNDAVFDYKSNKVVKGNTYLKAVFEPINYELYLSYLRDTRDTEKDVNAFDTINTELRTFTYEDTLVNFQKDDDGKITENYLARLPATVTGNTKDDCFYKGHILSDGWYMLPEKTKIKNIIIEDDEFLEKTFGPKSALCYCEPQTYNIYYIEKLPEVINSNTKIKVIQKREGVSYNESVTLLSGNEDSSIHGYNELGRYHKVLFPEPFAEPDNDDILSAADLGFANSDGTSVKYDPEEFFYGQTARNICGDFSFDEDNKTARIPNVYLEYMYEINDQSIQIKYSDNVNTIKTFNISAVEGKNAEIISFINANNDNAGLQYTNNNLNFFNTDKIFRKYKLMHLNEKNEPEQLSLMTGYFSGAPNEYTVTHNDFVQIYNLLLEDSTVYLAPIWESYKYDVEFIYNEKSTTLTLESAKKYILDIGNTTDYIFNVGDVGSSNDTIDLKNFITHFTDVTAEIYSYYVGWANTNGILRYTAGQAGLTNLVPISKNSVFDGNKKLTSDKLTLQAFFTRRMTNKNGVIFKEGDHYYCDDTKLMLINISNNGFWTIDTVFG